MNKFYLLLDNPLTSGSIEHEISKMSTPLLLVDYQTCPTAKGLSIEYCSLLFNLNAFQGPDTQVSSSLQGFILEI